MRVERRGSVRTDRPLSAFAPTPIDDEPFGATAAVVNVTDLAVNHLLPMLEYAASIVAPAAYHATTPIHYAATAGMRLLRDADQALVYAAVCAIFDDFALFPRHSAATLSGAAEGYYGVVAANYLHGSIHANLTHRLPATAIVGALDMGGSSTQMVFYTKPHGIENNGIVAEEEATTTECSTTFVDSEQQQLGERRRKTNNNTGNETKLHADHFFSTSYLSYGVDQFRERLWTMFVHEHTADSADATADITADATVTIVEKAVPNPCGNPGHTDDWLGHTLLGTGDAAACAVAVERLIPHPTLVQPPREQLQQQGDTLVVGGVEHPPVASSSSSSTPSTFLAMSLYYFSLDALRVLTDHAAVQAAWPTPSLHELADALPLLCGRHISALRQDAAHAYTRPQVLPHRCYEAVYMVSLLRSFGFQPHARDVTFAFEVNDSEVEWTLGMALQLRSDDESVDEQTCTWVDAFVPDIAAAVVSKNDNDDKEDEQRCVVKTAAASGESASDERGAVKKKNETVDVRKRRSRSSGWVLQLAEVLVSDGELFSTIR